MEATGLDATATPEPVGSQARKSSASLVEVLPVTDRSAVPAAQPIHEEEPSVAASLPSSVASLRKLSLAREKRPAPSEPIPGAELAQAPALPLKRSVASARYPMPVVPVDYRVEAAGRRERGWSVSQVCLGVCAVSLFVLSALFAGTLAVHTVRRVGIVSRLLQEIVNETKLRVPEEGATSASATTMSPSSRHGGAGVGVTNGAVAAGNSAAGVVVLQNESSVSLEHSRQ